MSEAITTVAAFVAEETKIADAITNTSRRLDSLNASMPELEANLKAKGDAFGALVANGGHKTVYAEYIAPESRARDAAKAEIESLGFSLTSLRAKLTVARRATSIEENKARAARELADLVKLCDALEPALIINERLKAEHDKAGSMHWSNALPWLDRTLIDGLRSFVKVQTAPLARKPLPSTHVLVKFVKSWPGSPASSSIGATTAYSVGETAGLLRRTAASLEAAGVVCAAN